MKTNKPLQFLLVLAVGGALVSAACAQDMFPWLDMNKDGTVMQEEFLEMRQKAAKDNTKAPGDRVRIDMFKRMDASGDGVLSREEFEQWKASQEAGFTASDPGEPLKSKASPDAPVPNDKSLPHAGSQLEEKVEAILSQLTLEEKVAMCLGGGGMEFKGVPRLDLPNMVCTDGPRGPGQSTGFPTGVAFGASWNPPLVEKAAAVMGLETRAKGATMLLAPAINILRDPLNGRFFEYFTEDPHLNSELTVAFVQGLQSQKVAASVKHYAANNRDANRDSYSSEVDRRTLEEIYLPAFKAGVQRGGAWSVMTTANRVNGEYVSDSRFLLTDILKDGWRFDGLVITDWCGTRSTELAALAGLDVSMPFRANSPFGAPLLAAVKEGRVPEEVIDDKARRLLRTMGRVGLLDGVAQTKGGVDRKKEHYELAREAAAEGMVLLKNENNLLPLDAADPGKILVTGFSADRRFCLPGLGGSSSVHPPYEITALAGLKNIAGDKVVYYPLDDLAGYRPIMAQDLEEKDGQRGFEAKYFQTSRAEPVRGRVTGKPLVTRVDPAIDFLWEMKSPAPGQIAPDFFRASYSAKIIPPVTGSYSFRLTSGGGQAGVYVKEFGGAPLLMADPSRGSAVATTELNLKAGEPFYLRVEYSKMKGDAAVRLEWMPPLDEKERLAAFDGLAAAAKEAHTVIVVGGLDHSVDTEGRDRTDMKFPALHEAVIRAVAGANPRTVVVLINGSPVEIGGWIDQVPAVLEAWYPGMEGGNAIADILFGRINPSGKLPFSWPKTLADSPSHKLARQDVETVHYDEGVFIGYRYFDTKGVEPQFPFGFGLSYTDFEYGGLQVVPDGDKVKVSFTVTNRGKMAGAEVAQLYVGAPEGAADRPMHELKGFRKVLLQPGAAESVEIQLGPDAFATFDPKQEKWVVPPGDYTIKVGGSSRSLPLQEKVKRGSE
jgi:beta-glucosidase